LQLTITEPGPIFTLHNFLIIDPYSYFALIFATSNPLLTSLRLGP